MKPIRLVVTPLFVWCAAGLVLLFDGAHAMDYFPYLWAANDISIMIAFAGLMMHLFGAGKAQAPVRDEWTNWDPLGDLDAPLEELLVKLARAIEAETRVP